MKAFRKFLFWMHLTAGALRKRLWLLAAPEGARTASFFWIQSMVRDDGQRTLLFDLDMSIQQVAAELPDGSSAVKLTGVYHNLLRR